MTLGDYIKKYRTTNHISMDEFANRSGMSKAYVSILERNHNPSTGKAAVPSLETIKRVAAATYVDFNDLIVMLDGDQQVSLIPPGFSPLPETTRVPRVGRIACGDPITAAENIDSYDIVPRDWRCDFTLLCCGDSMSPKIEDSDVVAIRKQDEVKNGEIAAVRVGDEATLKYVYIHPDYIELRPANPAYESIIRRKDEMNDVRIEGKAVGFFREV